MKKNGNFKVAQSGHIVEVSKEEYRVDLSDFAYSLFLLSEWIDAFSFGYQAVYLHFIINNEVVGKIGGLVVGGSRFSGNYLFFYAGPGLKVMDPDLYNKFMEALLYYSKKHRYARIDMQCMDQQFQWRCGVRGYIPRGYNEYIRFFDGGNQPLFSKSFMKNVRKAEKAGATFHEETSERVLNRMHELLLETKKLRDRKYGGSYRPYPFGFMTRRVVDELFSRRALRLYYAQVDIVIHVVQCVMERDKRMFALMIASDGFAYDNSLQHFVQYHIIYELKQAGYLYYNLAAADNIKGDKSLASHKMSVGALPHYVFGVYTHYIIYPQKLLNPLMTIGRKLSKFPLFKDIVAFGSRFISGTIRING